MAKIHMDIDGVDVTLITSSRLVRFMRKIGINKRLLGITLGSTIRWGGLPKDVTQWFLAHEFCHVLQYKRMGFFKFYWTYLTGLLKTSYHTHPMEVEAHDYGIANGSRMVTYLGPLAKIDK